MNKLEKLLIVRTDRIGDVVLSLPVAGIVKKFYPGVKITFFVRNYTKSIVMNHAMVDEILVLDEIDGKPRFLSNVRKLKKSDFDAVILVYPTFILSLIVFLSGIKKRVATGYRWYSFLFNYKVYTHRKFAEKHELDFNVELLKQIGIDYKTNAGNVEFNLPIDNKAIDKVNGVLKNLGIILRKPVIIVHPGSGGSAVDLPINKFKELLEKISRSGKFTVILTGSKSEQSLCRELSISPDIINFAGLFELPELIALIDKSDLFISNSTGPLHIAAAMGKFVIGFYPKILACSSKRWGPYSEKSYVFEPEINCKDCTRVQCESLNCMNSINIDRVIEKIESIHEVIIHNGEIHV